MSDSKRFFFFLLIILTGCAPLKHDPLSQQIAKLPAFSTVLNKQLFDYVAFLENEKFLDLEDNFLASIDGEESAKHLLVNKKISERFVHVLVNRDNPLPVNFVPPVLVHVKIPFSCHTPADRTKLHYEAAQAAEHLFEDAKNASLDLIGVSGYRSYQRQHSIFSRYCEQHGIVQAARFSAPAGMSEHQTGLALDVSCKSIQGDLSEEFEYTKEGQWLQKNCARYGFILRYPKHKEHITGYQYEPWHLRYVGIEMALLLQSLKLTLEEFALHKRYDK